jgi:hypothetical protein
MYGLGPGCRGLVALLALLDTLEEAVVGRLLGVVVVPQQRGALGSKNTRDPRILVGDTPDSHTDTPLDSKARPGNALVGSSLDLELLGGGRSVHANVDLSVDNINALVGGGSERGLKGGLIRDSTGSSGCALAGEVGLVSSAIDEVLAIGLDKLDDTLRSLGLCAVVLKVVIVVVQLRLLVGVLAGELEGDGDECIANCVVEHALPVSTVLIQGLVDDVPAGASVLPAAGNVFDVVLHDGDQGLVVEAACGHPCGKLAVPNKGVAVNLLIVLLGERNNFVTTGKGEIVAGGLGRLPLHSILRSDRVEVLVDDLGLSSLVTDCQSCANELATTLTHSLVKAGLLRLGATARC